MTSPENDGPLLRLDIGNVAHGGFCVARHDGQVVFVRGALPGEVVMAQVTEAPAHGRFLRADAVEVITPSPHRVAPPCRYAGDCGGCDWQFVAVSEQRRLKAAVVREQLTRLGGEPAERWAGLEVEAVPGDVDGLAWRTRMRFAVDDRGRLGLRAARSHRIVEIDQCLIASAGIDGLGLTRQEWVDASEVLAVSPSEGHPIALPDPRPGEARVREIAAGRTWTFDATAFWQVHPGAADTLSHAVLDLLAPRPGEHAIDLYAGVGLFAGALAEPLGPGGRIDAVESDTTAVAGARRSLHDVPTVHLHEARVDQWLRQTGLRRCDLVVLDPPRVGAKKDVMQGIVKLRPRAIAYVACDPAALGRDIAIAKSLGWELSAIRAFDLFPMTHHVECVALLTPASVGS
ncbi:MAG: hypothetical protein B7C55_05240 [Actinomycetales bacterium mxb001]|nr:MAG: hypothetical protein B7C55_05240 [Actinomycetales bacterium mxb001]